jgi:hypothetical protein
MSENEPIKLELQGTPREVHSPILTSAYDKNSLTQIQLDRTTAWSRIAGTNPQPDIHLRHHVPAHLKSSLERCARSRS